MTYIAHAYLVDNKDDYTHKQWIVDSGASKHIISDLKALFDTHVPSQGNEKQVHFPNGQTTTISHIGKYKWNGRDVLKDVLAVPNFKYDLLSVS